MITGGRGFNSRSSPSALIFRFVDPLTQMLRMSCTCITHQPNSDMPYLDNPGVKCFTCVPICVQSQCCEFKILSFYWTLSLRCEALFFWYFATLIVWLWTSFDNFQNYCKFYRYDGCRIEERADKEEQIKDYLTPEQVWRIRNLQHIQGKFITFIDICKTHNTCYGI